MAASGTTALLLAGAGMDCQGNVTPGGCDTSSTTGGPVILPTDHVLGDASAKVTVVEYLDFQ